jgi:hypothetical protein
VQQAFTLNGAGSSPVRSTTQPSGVGVKVTRQVLTLDEAGSIPVPPTSDSLQCPAAWDLVSDTEEKGSTPFTASEKNVD